MLNFASLAWLHWNPAREAFTIPYFDLSVAWYGILFATGFILGYFILLPMIKRHIWLGNRLYERDIESWIIFTHRIKEQPAYTQLLTSNTRKELQALPKGGMPSVDLQKSILNELNQAIQNDNSDVTRKSIEKDFPDSINSARALSLAFADKLTWFVVIGTIVGARLGHVLFYDLDVYVANPLEIFMLRKGGLASHGGAIGVIIALALFMYFNRKKYPDISFICLIDILVVPTACTVFFIRLGNFFNQEILGRETTLPWGVIFEHPLDGSLPVPRHPVQLYEGFIYLATFFFLYALWRWRGPSLKVGTLSGLFFILVFGSRFFVEFLKELQGSIIDETFLQMGQYLSLPFVALGFFLLFAPARWLTRKPILEVR